MESRHEKSLCNTGNLLSHVSWSPEGGWLQDGLSRCFMNIITKPSASPPLPTLANGSYPHSSKTAGIVPNNLITTCGVFSAWRGRLFLSWGLRGYKSFPGRHLHWETSLQDSLTKTTSYIHAKPITAMGNCLILSNWDFVSELGIEFLSLKDRILKIIGALPTRLVSLNHVFYTYYEELQFFSKYTRFWNSSNTPLKSGMFLRLVVFWLLMMWFSSSLHVLA